MRRFFAWATALGFVLLAAWPLYAAALTAQQVYQKTKDSVYILYSLDAQTRDVKARGSAVAITKTTLATNCHVALSGDYLVVQTQNGGKPQVARLYYKNEKHDLCLLEVPGANFKPVQLRPSAKVQVGEVVYAIGNPKGTERSMSKGIISNRHPVQGGVWLQTDAAIYFGSSGGGLFDEEGNLIGITTKMGGNFGFALPTEWIVQVMTVPHKSVPVVAAQTEATPEKTEVHPEATQGLSRLGTYGKDRVGLYRNNRECFLLIQGRDTNGNISSAILWNPKYETTFVVFPTVATSEEAMNIIYDAVVKNKTEKQNTYQSKSILYIANQPYSLFGTQGESKKYGFLVTRFSESPKSALLNSRAFRVVFKDEDPVIGNATMVYQLNGIAEALSSYNINCGQ